jgi:hypothetical protein
LYKFKKILSIDFNLIVCQNLICKSIVFIVEESQEMQDNLRVKLIICNIILINRSHSNGLGWVSLINGVRL